MIFYKPLTYVNETLGCFYFAKKIRFIYFIVGRAVKVYCLVLLLISRKSSLILKERLLCSPHN